MTTWVLLRGLMRETRHWGKFPVLFQKELSAKNIVTLDFPGNGKLHGQVSPDSVTGMADYCHIQLMQLGHTPPYNLLALSLGAMVAVAWSEQYPSELDKMVLINTSLSPYNPFYHRLRPENYPALIRHLLLGSAGQRESLILKLTSSLVNPLASDAKRKQKILAQWTAYAREYPITRANILRQLRAAVSYRAAPEAPSAPVLLLAAQQDRLVDVHCSLTLAQHWGCPIRLHPAAGHDLPLDDGVWVSQQVKDWLNM
jgi:pimeloyl-ACP methyl ester carboxylesterase